MSCLAKTKQNKNKLTKTCHVDAQWVERKHRWITKQNQKNDACTKWEYQQIDRNYFLKDPNKNYTTEKYNKWTEKLMRGI